MFVLRIAFDLVNDVEATGVVWTLSTGGDPGLGGTPPPEIRPGIARGRRLPVREIPSSDVRRKDSLGFKEVEWGLNCGVGGKGL